MSESGDKSSELSMSERSEEWGRDDGCGEWCRCRSLGKEVRDERLVGLKRERRRWFMKVSEENSVLPRRDGGHPLDDHLHRRAHRGMDKSRGGSVLTGTGDQTA